jgi:hypothetical protein
MSKSGLFSLGTDDYSIQAFDRAIETTKATAIDNIHSYFSKKPHDAIREDIRHNTKPGDLVLDPFCAPGDRTRGVDGEPARCCHRQMSAASFITKSYCSPVNTNALLDGYDRVFTLGEACN